MNDLDLELTAAARDYDVPPGDVSAVLDRARRRARRRHRLFAATAVVALAGASLAMIDLGDDGDRTPIAALGSPGPHAGDAGITWQAVEPTSALGLMRSDAAVQSGDLLYALSTAPGEADPLKPAPLRVWTSTDGVDWSAGPERPDDLYLSELAARDERIYAVGTGQASAAVVDGRSIPEVRVGWSDDGADSWRTAPLDIDLAGIAEHATSIGLGGQQSVAAGAAGAVAVVGVSAELDVPEVLPPGDTAPDGWAVTPTGIDVLGPPSDHDPCPQPTPSTSLGTGPGDKTGAHRVWPTYCGRDGGTSTVVTPQDARGVVRSYTWDELGVGGDLRRAVLGQPFAFAADADGTTFERIELPEVSMPASFATLAGGDDGFTLVLSAVDRETDSRYLQSADGRAWTIADTSPSGLQWVGAAGTVGGHTVLAGSDRDGHPLAVIGSAAAGWQSTRLDELVDPALVDGRQVYWGGGGVGPLGIVAVATITDDKRDDVDTVLLVSRDGETWDVRNLDELAGEPVQGIGRVVVTADRIVVSVIPRRERAAGAHLPQVALVGTPG